MKSGSSEGLAGPSAGLLYLRIAVDYGNLVGDAEPMIGCMAAHPNKHIREAIRYAEDHGWTFSKASGRAHILERCGVHRATVTAAGSAFIRRHAAQRIMPGVSVARSTSARTEGTVS
jgi:hypothetical protein